VAADTLDVFRWFAGTKKVIGALPPAPVPLLEEEEGDGGLLIEELLLLVFDICCDLSICYY
jgi:hypothetical protein